MRVRALTGLAVAGLALVLGTGCRIHQSITAICRSPLWSVRRRKSSATNSEAPRKDFSRPICRSATMLRSFAWTRQASTTLSA